MAGIKTRRVSDNFARASNVIQSDKSVMSDGCQSLVLQDFAKLFGEYFDLNGAPKMEIVCERGVYRVTVRFEADRVKKFNVLKG
ncbi:MAG: hypothetical protein IJY62_04160 [Clostridia bacterium]|nr:hypothetical protein [Clostridia bacterium]